MAEQFSIPTVGDLIAGKYRVVEELGRGAYGVVFRASQHELNRDVAVKTLLPQAFLQQDIVERFQREAQLISRLDHPNIIRLYDYGVDEGLLYMAVEYVQGRTLMDRIENDAPLDVDEVRKTIVQILDALEHAHASGIVHRDLKPDNIILLEEQPLDNVAQTVKILDFGISKLIRGDADTGGALRSLTQDGTVLGTPHYMSPENIVGDPIDHRADLYAVGVIMYEMLTGKHPFDAPSPSAVMVRHLRDDPPDLPERLRGTSFDHAIQRCLQKQPDDRIESAAQVREIVDTEPRAPFLPPASASGKIERKTRPTRFRPAILTLALVLLSLFVGAIIWAVRPTSPDPQDGVSQVTAAPRPASDVPEPSPSPAEAMIFELSEPDAGHAALASPDADSSPRVAAEEPAHRNLDEADRERNSAPRPEPEDSRREPRNARVSRSTARTTSSRTERPQARDFVVLKISSVPSNARVTIDGVPVGSTPLRHKVAPEDKSLAIRFSHIGYKNKLVRVQATQDKEIRAHLEKDRIHLVD